MGEEFESLPGTARRQDAEVTPKGQLEDPQVVALVVDVEDRILAMICSSVKRFRFISSPTGPKASLRDWIHDRGAGQSPAIK
ncbi:MAG: hypothetical protein CL933_23520 [Deltaproteobacteria bacterium]|nr:hypothetical protein [Deltaproteobacteria bacterium]